MSVAEEEVARVEVAPVDVAPVEMWWLGTYKASTRV
jgi:hypothetical protein